MVATEAPVVEQDPPAIEYSLDARVGIRDLPPHQRHVEREPVLAQIEVVEPGGRRPQVPGADRDRLDPCGPEPATGRHQIGKGPWRVGDPCRGQQITTIVEPDLVIRVGNAILPAAMADELECRRMDAGPRLRRVEITQVRKKTRRRELAHPMPREPEHHVGRRASEPVPDRLLVTLVVVDVEFDPDVGVFAPEVVDGGFPCSAWRGVGAVRVDHERAVPGRSIADEEKGKATQQAGEHVDVQHRFAASARRAFYNDGTVE